MEKQWAVRSAIIVSAKKRVREFHIATLIGLVGTLAAAVAQLLSNKVSSWTFIILASMSLLAFLGESFARYRIKNNLYGTERSEVRDIIRDITAEQP